MHLDALTPRQTGLAVIQAIQAGIPVMIHGSPGIGKSSITHQVADFFDLALIDIRLAQCDVTDLNGFPYSDSERSRSGYYPLDTFPIKGDPLPKDKKGWLLFLDEFTAADPDIQKAAYKLVLDRQVGAYDLHPEVHIVLAGNLVTDKAFIEEMASPMASRMCHLKMEVSASAWLEWAYSAKISYEITAFIEQHPDQLYTFTKFLESEDATYACPRTWEMADRLIKKFPMRDKITRAMLEGTVGAGTTSVFYAYIDVFSHLPSYEAILKDPTTVELPDEHEVGKLLALANKISAKATKKDLPMLMQYVNRMPLEFQAALLRSACMREPAFTQEKSITAWQAANASKIY